MMNIDKYRILLLISENKRVSEIAQILNISQPTVSFHLKSLEETLGIKVFNTQNKFITLTEAGKNILSYAYKIVQLENILEEKAHQYKNFNLGSITIGATLAPGISFLPDIITQFTKAHHNLHINLETGSTNHIIKNITARKYDIGFISSNTELPTFLYSKQLKKDSLVLIFPHCLSSIFNKENFYDYLNQFNFIHHSGSSSTRQIVDKYFLEHHIHILSSITANSVEVIKALVKKEIGISILPFSLVEEAINHELFGYIALNDPKLVKDVKLIYHNELYISPVIDKFLYYC